jgi:hypothetical protein
MPTYIIFINVKCNSEFKYFITNNDHFKIKTILRKTYVLVIFPFSFGWKHKTKEMKKVHFLAMITALLM